MLINNSEFLIKESEIPRTPIKFSLDAKDWYKEQKKRCLEGYWVGGKYMPPQLYFYVNFWNILLNKGKSKSKIISKPWLRDVEWEVFPAYLCARGLSGFDGNLDIANTPEGVWEWLKNNQKSYGCPHYDNDAKDLMLTTARETGKSFMTSAMVAHEWLFNGQKNYLLPNEDGFQRTTANITVGAGDSKFSSRLLVKVKMGLDILASQGIEFAGRYYPHPFFQSYSGSWSPGKQIVAKYKKKVGGTWQEVGSMSTINHVSYKDNDYAAQGSRNSLMVKEEVGMFNNLEEAREADKETMMNGTTKYGSCVYIGCVCAGTKVYTGDGRVVNIEYLKQKDGIIGFDGKKSVKQNINYFNPPQKKECVRIYTDNGNIIECSSDHPFLTTKRKSVSHGKKISTFTLADKIEVKHQILSPNSVPIFGNTIIDNARLFGLLIGDGNYSDSSVSISISEKEILDFVSPYITTKSHEYKISEDRDYCQAFLSSKIKQQLRENGMLGEVKDKKRLPKDIHTYSRESLAELIGGYFDADGNVYYNKKKDITRIVLTSVVPELLEEVKYQLLKFGIHCSIFKENRNTTPSYEYRGQKKFICRLYISQQQDIKLFRENIKLLVKEKNDKIICKKSKYGLTDSIFIINKENNKEHYFNRESPNRDELYDLRYETVIKVEKIGLKDVYNLNCNDNHNYICNSLISSQTGGDMERGTLGTYKMFYSPEVYDIMSFEDKWEQKGKIGLFIPATMRPNEFKDSEGNTNYVIATEYFEKERELLRNSKNGSAPLNAFIQYNPIKPSEVFLRTNVNIFPVSEIKEWLADLEVKQIYQDAEMVCELIFDENGNIKPSINKDLSAIRDFPLEKEKDSNGAVVIFHHPDTSDDGMIPYGRYIAGIDPYDADKSTTSSLGSMIVMDRLSNRVVAEYSGRPKFADMFYENCRRLSIYYNAATLYENEKMGVKQYYERKNSLQYLMRQPQYIKDVIPNSTVERGYGCHMNVALKDHGEILTRDWLQEEYEIGKLNVRKIRCVPLLKEMILYDSDHGNYDRVSAFLMCMYAMQELHKQKVITAIERTRGRDPFFDRRLNQKSYRDYRNTNQPI